MPKKRSKHSNNKPTKRPAASRGFDCFLFYLIQFTWGLSVNLIGFLVWLVCKLRGRRTEKYCNCFITYVKKKHFGGLSLGLFVFMSDDKDEQWVYNTRIHEYGHTIQCLLLGPLYWIVVAIPSAIWCNFFEGYRKKNDVSYYALYCESWANKWGESWSAQKRIGKKPLKATKKA